jgi:hypothetical protein
MTTASERKLTPIQEQFMEIIRNTVPAKYQPTVMELLKPSPLSRLPMEEQEKLYKELLDHQNDGWAFFAPAGYSKTTCSYALYRRAVHENLKQWWPQQHLYWAWDYPHRADPFSAPATDWNHHRPRIYVWRKSVPDLLQQHFTLFNYTGADDESRPPQPDITVEKIEEAVHRGFKPRVFLEEIDKIKPSEFAIHQIFRIFDALDRHKGQLVIDTNLGKQFMDVYGEPIARRVKENCHVKEYGFQGGTE